ncbi:MAG: GxxExxY protein [Lysobacterales bacterium]|jgi:GxxExxY protein
MNLTGKVIACALEVHRNLGCGFLESVYEHALACEMATRRIPFRRQSAIDVFYRQQRIGRFVADFIVSDELLLELKALQRIVPSSQAQTLHYLKATGLHVGLILNFGSEHLQIKRMVMNYEN